MAQVVPLRKHLGLDVHKSRYIEKLLIVGILESTDVKSRIRIHILNPVYESKDSDPDLSQNVPDPEQ
jgi:hypothetical protein